jgi:hypothetical protein
MVDKSPSPAQLYLFLCAAFVTFVGTFLPWVCYQGPGDSICADGYSRALFASGQLNLLNNGGLVLLLLLLFVLVAALQRHGFDPGGLPTALGALIILSLVTLFYLNAAWRGSYQPLNDGGVPQLQAGLILALLGEVFMVATAGRAWIRWRPTRPTLEMEKEER